jgi:hypothetical protein
MAKSNDREKYHIRDGAGRKTMIASLSRTGVGKFPLELQAEGNVFLCFKQADRETLM